MFEFDLDDKIQKWARYIGIDKETGKAHVFHKKPIMINGWWVPNEFRSQNKRSCVKLKEEFNSFHGKLMKRRKRKGKYYYEFINE